MWTPLGSDVCVLRHVSTSCWPFGFLCFFLGTYTPNGANVFCFLSSLPLLPQPPQHGIANAGLLKYGGKGFLGPKKKTIVGYLVFNPLCTHKSKPDAFSNKSTKTERCGRFSRKRNDYKFEEFSGTLFQPWYLVFWGRGSVEKRLLASGERNWFVPDYIHWETLFSASLLQLML
jgi:hypothetical protein